MAVPNSLQYNLNIKQDKIDQYRWMEEYKGQQNSIDQRDRRWCQYSGSLIVVMYPVGITGKENVKES